MPGTWLYYWVFIWNNVNFGFIIILLPFSIGKDGISVFLIDRPSGLLTSAICNNYGINSIKEDKT